MLYICNRLTLWSSQDQLRAIKRYKHCNALLLHFTLHCELFLLLIFIINRSWQTTKTESNIIIAAAAVAGAIFVGQSKTLTLSQPPHPSLSINAEH